MQETQPLPRPLNGAVTSDGSIVFPSEPEPTSPRRRQRSFWNELRRWVVTLSIFACLAVVLLVASLFAAIYIQARSDQTRPVDAIVVMGAAQFDGRPSAVLRARLDEALAAYEAGNAPFLVVTGGQQAGDRFTEARASRDYLIERGVPADAILMEDEGRNSWQSLQAVARLLEDRDLERVLLVSDGFHLFRVKLMARDLGLEPFGVAADESPIRAWSGAEFGFIIREAAGIVSFQWDQW
ncbi:MAG: YdcF family protein [Thermomicrobiales bacterium]